MLWYRVGNEKVARLPFSHVLVIFSLALVCILCRVFEQLVNSRAVTMLRYTQCNIVILMAATVWLMLSFSPCIVCGFDSYSVFSKCPQKITNQICTRYRNWRTASATQLQPSESLCYIGYTSAWLDVYSCVLMQEATTFNIFYDINILPAFGYRINFCIYAMLRTWATFSWPTLYQ